VRLPWQRDDRDSEADLARTPLTERDDRLSDYLDGLMAQGDRRALETDLERDADLRAALEGMRAVKASMGMLGLTRAPRSFALSPATAPRPAGAPRIELFARFGAVAAALVLTVVTLVPTMTGQVAQESMMRSSDTSATSSQADSSAEKRAAEAPAAGGSRAAAPAQAPEGGPAAGGALAAPAAAPAAPAAPQPFGTTAASSAPSEGAGTQSALATPEPAPLRPVELSRAEPRGVLWYAQIVLAGLTVGLGLAAVGLFARRQFLQ